MIVEEANEVIKSFKENDKNNIRDSRGWSFISEKNYSEMLSNESGILENEIMYLG